MATRVETPRIRFLPNDPLEPSGLTETLPAPDASRDNPRAVVVPENGTTPPAGVYPRGSRAFRHWQLAEALHRGVRLWRDLAPGFRAWQGGRAELPAVPDGGEELNAWYDRASLVFCHVHDRAAGGAVYASQSVDVACHEQAHAVLDALRPDLWDAAAFEAAAFHEAFADIGALLVALDDARLRETAVRETRSDLRASNTVSRLAEQLGTAARDLYGSDAASEGCLRDAANGFVYRPPLELPASGPDSELTREPHSFSRVFSGAFYEALARAARALGDPVDGAALGRAGLALGRALAQAAGWRGLCSRSTRPWRGPGSGRSSRAGRVPLRCARRWLPAGCRLRGPPRRRRRRRRGSACGTRTGKWSVSPCTPAVASKRPRSWTISSCTGGWRAARRRAGPERRPGRESAPGRPAPAHFPGRESAARTAARPTGSSSPAGVGGCGGSASTAGDRPRGLC